MRRAIRTSVRLFSETFSPRGRIVELGSKYEPGYRDLGDLRPLFPGTRYVGVDLRRGLGVDVVQDAERLGVRDGAADVVVLCEILEHVRHPDRVIREARRIMKSDGFVVLSVPFTYRLHGFPTDYRRFTPSGIDVVLSEFPLRTVFALGPRLKPSFVFAVASETAPGFCSSEVAFRAAVEREFTRPSSRARGWWSEFKERGRDFVGLLIGRAEMEAAFFDPEQPGGYRRD